MDKPQIHENVRQDERVVNSLRCKCMRGLGVREEMIGRKNDRKYIYYIFIYTIYIYIMYAYINIYVWRGSV